MTTTPSPSDYGADPHNERPRTPLAYYRMEPNMINCPCCDSGFIETNRIENKHPLDTATTVIEKLKDGKTSHAAGEAALWGFKALWNSMRAKWKCTRCGAVF